VGQWLYRATVYAVEPGARLKAHNSFSFLYFLFLSISAMPLSLPQGHDELLKGMQNHVAAGVVAVAMQLQISEKFKKFGRPHQR
jgi:hypothetical protein